MKLIIYFILFSYSIYFSQTTYYISNSDGNDDNSGTSYSQPFKTISKLNSIITSPGDKVLFKRNDIWKGEYLLIKKSGNSSNPITYSSYGDGEKPIIDGRTQLPNWKNPSNWLQLDIPNVWRISLPHDLRISRLWLNGVEEKMAYDYKLQSDTPHKLRRGDNGDGTVGVCNKHKFFSNKNQNYFYLYAPNNPAQYYKEILIPGSISDGKVQRTTVDISADYIHFKDLDVRGSMYTSVGLNGADYILIDNCNIGRYSNWSGIIGDMRKREDKTSDYVTISNCKIDSYWDYQYIFYTQETPWGIAIANGAKHWDVYNNLIKDWWMSVDIISKEDNSQYHHIHNNEITGPNNTFSKAIQTAAGGDWGTSSETYVYFYNNFIHDVVFGIQVSSSSNFFYNNIFKDLTLVSVNEHAFGAGGWGSQIISGDIHTKNRDNFFLNNTFYNLNSPAHIYSGWNHHYINNLYINCGRNKNGIAVKVPDESAGSWQNNLFYFQGSTNSSNLIYINNIGSFSVSEFNSINGKYNKEILDNIFYSGNEANLIDSETFILPTGSPALNAGVDISDLVPEGFKDRFGNIVNRLNPNIGAFGGNNSPSPLGGSDPPLDLDEKSIQIISPNGGEIWNATNKKQIKWLSSGNIKSVHVFYSFDGGNTWAQISAQENNGLLNWNVPSINSDQCIVRVKDADDFSIVDKSDNLFKIVDNNIDTLSNPYIQIVSPNGGENWAAGSTQEIKWLSSGNIKSVHIFYSIDSGNTWTQISAQENNGLLNWNIPSINSDQCIIRVKDADDFSIVDKSDRTFSIVNDGEESKLRVFLEMPLKNNKMDNTLFTENLFPVKPPFNDKPWEKDNQTVITKINKNYIDWIFIGLRNELKNDKYIKSAIINDEGEVLNPDGSALFFSNISSGNYYVIVYHKNHLPIMSTKKIKINNNEPVNYNFTDVLEKAYGNNSMIKLENGKYGMIAGDADGNGVINNLDFGVVANNILFRGYHKADLDLNGTVNVLDYAYIKENILKKSNLPK